MILINTAVERVRDVILLFAMLVLISACATGNTKSLTIDARHVEGIRYMPSEIISMLEDLGYEWLPVRGSATPQGVQVAEDAGQYKMLFKAANNVPVMVEVIIRISDNRTRLYFAKVGNGQLDDIAADYYRKLKQRATLRFGVDSVSE